MPEVRRRGTPSTMGRVESAILAGTTAGGGHIEHTMRGLWGNNGDGGAGTTVTVVAGVETYSVSDVGTVSVDVPAGVYLCTGTYSVTLVADVTGMFIDVEIEHEGDTAATSTTVSATAGTPMSCTTSGAFVAVADGTITMTPSIIGGGTASAESSTLRATRIG